ncbi:triose-phosphate isomerase [Aerococcaceae bacterium NML210727]|nr:triose-phosphate isomerase [Aerococcaceae bacterium NML210727]MCW6653904.1 triose-phosphate isomerase [Aerococcaceae bacterium NML201296]
MKYIHLNLKRFDIKDTLGGVNRSGELKEWGAQIVQAVQERLEQIKQEHEVEFAVYLPEAHLISALTAVKQPEILKIGCQSVYRQDVEKGGNFGAFTTQRSAKSMAQLGVQGTIIGHFEERLDKNGLLQQAGVADVTVVNDILNQEMKQAQQAGLQVLYCIGESADERAKDWRSVLKVQLERGLNDIDLSRVVIGYEPTWAIGVGKQPPTADEISEVVTYIKEVIPNIPVIYGGGLKFDNAAPLSQITHLDGGLIALTRFTGEFGFYPDEYIAIIEKFLGIEGE